MFLGVLAIIVQAISLLLGLVGIFVEIRALIDVLRRKPEEFVRADQRPHSFWLAICVGALVVGILTTFGLLASFLATFSLMLEIAAVTAAGVYLVGVRPQLNMYGRAQRY